MANRFHLLRAAALAALMGCAVASANAQEFSNRIAFEAAVDADSSLTKTTENYDGVAAGTTFASGSAFNNVVYTTSGGEDLIITSAFLPLSSPNTLGRQSIEFFTGSDVVTLSFADPIRAFGISFNTFAGSTGDYALTTDTSETFDSFFDPFPGQGTGQFAGLISMNPFNSVTITAPGGFAFNLDDLIYASGAAAVPEPGTVALLIGSGIAGAGMMRRRRSRN